MSIYKYCCVPNHPNRYKNGCLDEHRIIAEQKIGRYLKPGEIVHHIDEDKFNNSIKNLIVFKDKKNHARYHKTGVLEESEEKNIFISPEQFRLCKCGEVLKQKRNKRCLKCHREYYKSKKKPLRDILLEDISNNSMVSVGKKYSVSDNAIRKWCISYNIDWRKH